MDGVWFRQASEADVPVILDFIKLLADYEKLSGEVVATEELLREWLFDRHAAEVISAWRATPRSALPCFFWQLLHLPRPRRHLSRGPFCQGTVPRTPATARALLGKLASIALERGCGRLEWACLDWNRPSIDFYLSLNARPMSDWTTYRRRRQRPSDSSRRAKNPEK